MAASYSSIFMHLLLLIASRWELTEWPEWMKPITTSGIVSLAQPGSISFEIQQVDAAADRLSVPGLQILRPNPSLGSPRTGRWQR